MKSAALIFAASVLFGEHAGQTPSKPKVSKPSAPLVASAKTSPRQAYVGTYRQGDGSLSTVSLQLRLDGSYSGELHGCMGVYGTAKGNWRIQDQQIVLRAIAEKDLMKGHLRVLDIVPYQKKIALLPTENRKDIPMFAKLGKASYLYLTKR